MYSVSQDFLNQMRAEKRKVEAKVVINYTDPFLDQSISISANEQANVSYPAQTADAVSEPFAKIASLDGSWVLDGSFALAPRPEEAATHQMGWWGSQLSGSDGSFTSPYPTLTVTHLARPVHSLKVTGDSARQEYPVDFVIRLYDAANTLLYEETVTGNTSIYWTKTLTSSINQVTKQVLEIHKWSHPGRQVKILEFFVSIQETYLTDDVVSIKLIEEREVSQGSIPVGNISANEVTLVLSNDGRKFDADNEESPLYGLLKPNRKIQLWLGANINGTIEWVPLGTFWSIDWDSPDDVMEATVTARDRLELLRKSTYKSSQVQTNVSLYTLAEQVLQDAGLTSGEYSIDTALQSIIVPYAWFDSMTHREALRIIAEAALAVVYCDRNGIIRIQTGEIAIAQIQDMAYIQGAAFPAETTSPHVFGIGPDEYYSPLRTPSNQDQVANEIVVTTQPLKPAATVQEVYRSNNPITILAGQTVTIIINYNQIPVIEAIASLDNPPAGVSISKVTYYGRGAEISIQNTGTSSANVTIVVTGRPLSVQNKEQAIARDEASIAENGVMRYEMSDNPLIQTLDRAQQIANILLASAKDPRRDIEMDWRGNPALELGDVVSIVTDVRKDRQSTYAVIRQEIQWKGALSAILSGRRIQ